MKILNFLKHKTKQYDIVLYNHQGTLKVGTILSIEETLDENIYYLDTNVSILGDNILKTLGNMKKIRKELYGE